LYDCRARVFGDLNCDRRWKGGRQREVEGGAAVARSLGWGCEKPLLQGERRAGLLGWAMTARVNQSAVAFFVVVGKGSEKLRPRAFSPLTLAVNSWTSIKPLLCYIIIRSSKIRGSSIQSRIQVSSFQRPSFDRCFRCFDSFEKFRLFRVSFAAAFRSLLKTLFL
jgi:hypothetical protein